MASHAAPGLAILSSCCRLLLRAFPTGTALLPSLPSLAMIVSSAVPMGPVVSSLSVRGRKPAPWSLM